MRMQFTRKDHGRKEKICLSYHLSGVGEDKDASDVKFQTCRKHELRKNLFFNYMGPCGPNHSCSSKMVEMTRVEQERIPYDNFYENEMASSTIVEPIAFHENTLEGYEQSSEDLDNISHLHPCLMVEIGQHKEEINETPSG